MYGNTDEFIRQKATDLRGAELAREVLTDQNSSSMMESMV